MLLYAYKNLDVIPSNSTVTAADTTTSNSTVTAADTTTWLVTVILEYLLHVHYIILSNWSNRHSGTTSQ